MGRIRKRTKKIIRIILTVVLCAVIMISGLVIYGKYQMSKIPGLTPIIQPC